MRIGSINGNMAVSAYGTSREESAIRKQILSLKKELQQLSSTEEEDEEQQETAIKQRELEQQIAQLEQKLQQVKREEARNNNLQSDMSDRERLFKEPGKGVNIDTYI